MTQLLALSGFQKVGGLVVGLIIFIWFVFLGFQLFKSEREPGSEVTQAPNRKPYFDDEELETSRLDRYLGFALFFMAISAIVLPLYYLNETQRQTNATESLNADAVARGKKVYTSYCVRCHADEGAGGVAATSVSSNPAVKGSPPMPVSWAAPPLNTVLRRFNDEAVNHIITYGRANTPMPPWGVAGGGPFNEQTVTDLVSYLGSIQLSVAKTKAESGQVHVCGNAETLCGYYYPYTVAPADDGERLFARYCSRCHTQGWSYGVPGVIGGGAFGANLTNGDSVRQFPDIDDQIAFVGQGTIANAPYGVRGVGSIAGGGMPGFAQSLTPAQIRAIVEYERNVLGAE